MDSINERFIELRKACKKNQSDFAKVLGLSRSGVTAIESGARKVTDKHLLMLSNWDEYNVNIDWLRTGEGDMFLPTETNALEILRKEYHLSDLQLSFVANFVRLPEDHKDIVLDFMQSISAKRESFTEKVQRESKECPDTLDAFEKVYPSVDPTDETKTG
nr:MAG TPA: helix-turn-helix domain protein [Caudoviricetes sp.]